MDGSIFSNIKNYLERMRTTVIKSESSVPPNECLVRVAAATASEPKGSFPFVSLPLEIWFKVYEVLLVPTPGTIDLFYTWT